jgi:hypothetical protein
MVKNQNRIDYRELEFKPTFQIVKSLDGASAATAANYGVIWNVDKPCVLVEIRYSHQTAGSDAGAVTLDVEKLTGTQALDAGVAMGSATHNLKSTANTVVVITQSTTSPNYILSPGDRVALKDAGTLTAVAGVCVTLVLKQLFGIGQKGTY